MASTLSLPLSDFSAAFPDISSENANVHSCMCVPAGLVQRLGSKLFCRLLEINIVSQHGLKWLKTGGWVMGDFCFSHLPPPSPTTLNIYSPQGSQEAARPRLRAAAYDVEQTRPDRVWGAGLFPNSALSKFLSYLEISSVRGGKK